MDKKLLLLWCSPGFGVVDVWLPIIRKLKNSNNIKVYFVFPESSSLRLEEKNSDLFNFAEIFADKVIYRGYSRRWFVSPTLVKARDGVDLNSYQKTMLSFSVRLSKGKVSKYFILKVIGKYILLLFKYVAYLKENDKSQSLYDISLLKCSKGIMCDIKVENKIANKELRTVLKNIPKFSMWHGYGGHWVVDDMLCKNSVRKRSDVVVYSMSYLETDGYKKCFGLLDKNIVHAGIPRHDSDWINFVRKKAHPIRANIFDSFVFIIGRPASSYNTPDRKKKALKNIYDIVCSKYNLKLVVKTHPKESIYGVDGDIYADALGSKNYGKDWMYSDSHPFILGEKSIFAISFYSGVPIDLLALNKLTIEYLDLHGLDKYDNENSLRDENNVPVFPTRYANLVLGASTKSDLEKHIKSIFNQYKETIAPLHLSYKECFSTFDGSSQMVANDICKRIG